MALGDIVLLKDRQPHGPYTRAQIQAGLSRGEFTPRDPAHTPGLRDWLPLLEVLHHLDREPVHAPRGDDRRDLPPLPRAAQPVSSLQAMAELGRRGAAVIPPLPAASSVSAAGSDVAPAELQPTPKKAVPPHLPRLSAFPSTHVPAPLRTRFLAGVIDWAVLFVPVLAVFVFAYGISLVRGSLEQRDPETAHQEQALLWRNLRELVMLVALGFAWIYAAGLESSRWQGTVGKQCMGLIVTDAAGGRIDFLRASGRHLAKYLSALPLFLGFMAACFNPQRLAWHDRLAGTRVMKR